MIWVSGQVGVDAAMHPATGMDAQAHLALRNLRSVLEAAGAGLADVVELTTFHTDLRGEMQAFAAVKDEYFPDRYPSWTAVGVTQLALPELCVEIRAVAVVAVIERDGGVIVQDFVPPSIVAELKADLLPGLGACSTGRDDFSGVRTRRMSALFAKSRRVADLVIHPLFLGAAEHFVDRLKSYPEQIQRLLGWSYMPETYMGWVEIDGEMADPIRLLAGDAPGNDASRELLPPAGRDDR